MTLTDTTVETWGTLFGVFLVAVLTQYNAWRAKQATQTVGQKLEESTAQRNTALANIHALVNGNMAAKLQKLAELTAQLATVTQDPAHQLAAKSARDEYDNHLARQTAIDAALVTALAKCPLGTLSPVAPDEPPSVGLANPAGVSGGAATQPPPAPKES